MIGSGTKINLFGDPIMIADTRKTEITMNLLTNTGSKIVGKV